MLSVILPTYDEAPNIEAFLRAVRAELRDPADEIVVVDDDSPDGTWRLVERSQASIPGLRLIRRVGRRGLTSALREGIAAARGERVGWLDCDFSMPPSLLPLLSAELDAGADVAVGSRYAPGGVDARMGAPLRRWASRAIVELAQAVLVPGFRDYTSGAAIARRSVLEKIALEGDHGEYFIDFIVRAHRAGARVAEVPYALGPRRAGRSKTDVGFVGKGVKYLATVARLARRAA